MKLKFNPIGSIFQEGNVILKVVEIKDPKTCKGCWYAGKTNGKGTGVHVTPSYMLAHQVTEKTGNRLFSQK